MPERSSHATVAVFDALEDQQQLTTATLRVLGCRVHPLNPGDNGLQDVVDQLEREGPFDVVLWDLPHAPRAPCEEFGDLYRRGAFASSGVVVTTPTLIGCSRCSTDGPGISRCWPAPIRSRR